MKEENTMTDKKDTHMGLSDKKIPYVDIKKIEEGDIPPEEAKKIDKVIKQRKRIGLKSLKEFDQE